VNDNPVLEDALGLLVVMEIWTIIEKTVINREERLWENMDAWEIHDE